MKNKEFWKTVIHIIVTILTALGTTLGAALNDKQLSVICRLQQPWCGDRPRHRVRSRPGSGCNPS